MQISPSVAMSPDRPLIVAGHSHTIALGVPVAGEGSTICLKPIVAHPNLYGLVGPAHRLGEYWAALSEYAAGSDVAVCWQGNLHFGLYLLQQNPKFDFVPSAQQDCSIIDDHIIVAESFVEDAFTVYFRELEEILKRLNSVGNARVLLVEGPAPRRSKEIMRDLVMKDDWFRARAASMGVDIYSVSIAPPLLLLKLHRLITRNMRRIANFHKTPYLAQPSITRDKEGYTYEQYLCDLTHGNESYGAEVLKNIRRYFSSL